MELLRIIMTAIMILKIWMHRNYRIKGDSETQRKGYVIMRDDDVLNDAF